MTLKIRIENENDWIELTRELKNRKLLDKDFIFYPGSFPAEIPLNVDNLFDMLNNPVTKPFRKKIETTLKTNLLKVKGAVC